MKLPNARPLRRSLMLACLTGSVLVLALSSCDRPESAGVRAPPAADLAIEAEPQLDAAALALGSSNESAAALDDYDIAHAAWGRRGWDQVTRLCRWFKDAGAPTLDCGEKP